MAEHPSILSSGFAVSANFPAAPNAPPALCPTNGVAQPIIKSAPPTPRSTEVSSSSHRTSDITSSSASVASVSMKEFVSSLSEEPLKTYKSLVGEVNLHGVDFPFHAYRESLEAIQKYLGKRNDFSTSQIAQRLHKSIGEELQKSQGPGFSSASKLIYEFVQHYPGGRHSPRGDYEVTTPRYIPFEAIRFRKEDGIVVFSFITQSDLNLIYFVNTRSVPVFAHGLGEGEDLTPPPYDGYNTPTRGGFLNHDEQHTGIMERRTSRAGMDESLKAHKKNVDYMAEITKERKFDIYCRMYFSDTEDHTVTEEEKEKILKERITIDTHNYGEMKMICDSMSRRTPLVAHALRLQRFYERLGHADSELQKPIEALAFFLFHEDAGGALSFDPAFINKVALFDYILNSDKPIEASELERNGDGIKMTLENCNKILTFRLSQDFSFPEEYTNPEVITKLPDAVEWMFNFLNEERLYQESEAGQREENSPEQQKLDEMMQTAAKKIKDAV